MNTVANGWLPVEAEAHKSWSPQKKKRKKKKKKKTE